MKNTLMNEGTKYQLAHQKENLIDLDDSDQSSESDSENNNQCRVVVSNRIHYNSETG